jgi:molybdate transport system substrate-binding protein
MKASALAFAAAAFVSMLVQNAPAEDPVRVLVSNGLKAAIEELQPSCERAIGRPVAVEFNSTAALKAKIDAGERFDAALITTEAIDDLIKHNKVSAGSRTELGRSPLVVGIRAGAPKGDIGSQEALKRRLLQAKSITYPRDGASRGYIEKMFAGLGIAEDLKEKIALMNGSKLATESVAAGQNELVLTLASEILPVPGLEVLGSLPGPLAYDIHFAGAASTGTANAEPVKALLSFLKGPQATPLFKSKGIEPSSATSR